MTPFAILVGLLGVLSLPLTSSKRSSKDESKISPTQELDNSTWEELMKAAAVATKDPNVQGQIGALTALTSKEELRAKSDQFLTSFQSLKIAYDQIQNKLRETEETCFAQAEFLRDWMAVQENKKTAMEDSGGGTDFEKMALEHLKKLYSLSVETNLQVTQSYAELFRINDLNSTLTQNQLSLDAEIAKLSNLIRKNDDALMAKMDRILTDIRILSKYEFQERVFFEETFTDEGWKKRWDPYVPGVEKERSFALIQQGPPYFINTALRTKESMTYQQGVVARFPEFSTKRMTLVLQYSLKYSIGDMFIRLHDCRTPFSSISTWDSYSMFFGNRNSKENGNQNQLLLKFKDPVTGQRFEMDQLINTIRGPNDGFTHIYTIEIDSDNNFRILIDDTLVFADLLKLSFFGFQEVCGLSLFNQYNPLSMEIDNILLTSDLNYAKQRREEVLQFMTIEKEFEYDSSVGSEDRSSGSGSRESVLIRV